MGGKIKIDSSEFLKIHRLLGAYNRLTLEAETHVDRYSSLVNVAGLQQALRAVGKARTDYGRDIHEANDIY